MSNNNVKTQIGLIIKIRSCSVIFKNQLKYLKDHLNFQSENPIGRCLKNKIRHFSTFNKMYCYTPHFTLLKLNKFERKS